MPWSPQFMAAIASDRIRPRYLFEQIDGHLPQPHSGYFQVSSHNEPSPGGGYGGQSYTPAILRGGNSISHARLQPGTWTRSHGALTIAIGVAHQHLLQELRRGSLMQLRIGFDGWSATEFERVWIGQVRAIRRVGAGWAIECVDMLGALNSRLTGDSVRAALFSPQIFSVLNATYTPGVSTSVTLLIGSFFEESSAGGGEGWMLRIQPDSGDPFYVLAANRAGNVFSSLDTTVAARYGTTPGIASSGRVCVSVPFSRTHPIYMAQRILMSDGAKTNDSNAFAEAWGLGLPRSLIDVDDLTFYRQLMTPASGTSVWDLLEPDPVPNVIAWLQSWLSGGGFFVGMHQGALTVRGVPSTLGPTTPSVESITDDDIVDITAHDLYSPDQRVEYGSFGAENTSGAGAATTPTGISTWPAAEQLLRQMPHVYENETAWGTEIAVRLGPYYTRIPERIRLVCRGWRLASVSPGDIVRLTSAHLLPRTTDASDVYKHRRCLVIGGGGDLFSITTTLELLALPSED